MSKIFRSLTFVFLLLALMSLGSSYGLTTQEARIDKEAEYLNMLKSDKSESAQAIVQEKEAKDKGSLPQAANAPKKVTLDIKGMDIVDVLKLLATQGNLNIVTGKNVSGRVSMFLKDVDVWDAFEIILAANDLAYEKKGDIIKVMSSHDYELIHGDKFQDKKILRTRKLKYASAKDVSTALNQLKSNLGKVVVDDSANMLILLDVPERIEAMENIIKETDTPFKLETRVFELKYAQSEKLKEKLQEVTTKDVGSLKTDERTNKIIVTDYPGKIARIAQIVEAFDAKTRQVLIEARIIQVTLSDAYKMGIDWKFVINKQVNLTAFNISRALTTTGSQVVMGTTNSPASPHDYKAIIDLLKTFGDAKTLSTPRITAVNGQEAKILVGSKKVYVTDTVTQTDSTTNTAEQVQFIDVGVKLYVTPTINNDGFISMKIRPEVSSASTDYTTARGNKIPIVETSEAETSVLVKDGVTIVMGGLMKNENTKNVYKIPLLGDIPFLGGFFRRTENSVTKTELVIFLTPHIISGDENLLDIKS